MCGYFLIGFIDFMLIDKSLLDYTNLFSPNECINTKIFSLTKSLRWNFYIALFVATKENFKILKYCTFLKKH